MTTEPPKRSKSIALRIEEWAPFVCSIFVFSCLLYWSNWISDKFASQEWKNAGLYSAIFGWSAIQTGFSFGVYGFVVGKSEGFVSKIRGTLAMNRFMGYIQRANITGFALTITSIPLIISELPVNSPMSAEYIAVCLWFSLFIWSFLSFLRLAYTFGHLASIKDKNFHGA